MSSRKQLQEDETFVHCPLYNYKGVIYLKGRIEAGCSQEEGPKKGFVMGSRTQGVPFLGPLLIILLGIKPRALHPTDPSSESRSHSHSYCSS